MNTRMKNFQTMTCDRSGPARRDALRRIFASTLAALVMASWFNSATAAVPNVVSVPTQPSASAAGGSFAPQFSADGLHLVFLSHANNLVTNDDTKPWLDLFVRDLASSNTVLVSVATNQFGGANADVLAFSISSNGQFVAFATRADNLVPGDTNGAVDVFLRDVVNGTTRLVSVDAQGHHLADPNPSSLVPLAGDPLISGDGRWVFFESRSTNVVPGGAPAGSVNIFARDTWSNVTRLVTADADGFALAGHSDLSSISDDGRFGAFITTNRQVVAGVTNSAGDAYARDIASGLTIWATRDANVWTGTNVYVTEGAALSGDGAYVAAWFRRPDWGYFVRHRLATLTTDYPVKPWANRTPQISRDGRFVLYEARTVYVYDFLNNTNIEVGWAEYDDQCGGCVPRPGLVDYSYNGRLTPDGRFVSFVLVNNVGPATGHFIYRRDLITGATNLVGVTTNGTPLNVAGPPTLPFALSSDGSRVAFERRANDVVADDLNESSDIFLRHIEEGATELVSAAVTPPRTAPAHSSVTLNSLSADGRFILSLRHDDSTVVFDTNHWLDVFLTDVSNGSSRAVSLPAPGSYTNAHGDVVFTGNTNANVTAALSADGTTIAAEQWAAPAQAGGPFVSVARSTNGDFSTSPLVFVASGSAPQLARDGLLLAFPTTSSAQEPNVNDNNGVSDVWLSFFFKRPFRYEPGLSDFQRRAPISWDGSGMGNGPSFAPRFSPDSAFLAFATRAGNLARTAPDDSTAPYAAYQIVVNVLGTNLLATNSLLYTARSNRLGSYSTIVTQTFAWIDAYDTNSYRTNVNFAFVPGSGETTNTVFSGDSRFLFYALSDGSAIYRHDLGAVHTNITLARYEPPNSPYAIVQTNIVPGALNTLVCTNCRNLSANGNGDLVAYERARGGAGLVDVVAKNLVTGEETLMSVNQFGAPANGSSLSPWITGDGRYVVFESRAHDLIAADANRASDVFVRDRLLGVTLLISANAQGMPANGPSTRPVLAPNGRTVAFHSFATDLVSGDINAHRDVFLLELGSADSDGDGLDDDWEVAHFGNLSRDGSEDFDRDGASDRNEFMAGTDPKNDGSVFRVLTVVAAGGGARQLIWSATPGRQYRAEFKDDATAPQWTPVSGTIVWNGTMASIIDTSATGTHRFYRAVRLP